MREPTASNRSPEQVRIARALGISVCLHAVFVALLPVLGNAWSPAVPGGNADTPEFTVTLQAALSHDADAVPGDASDESPSSHVEIRPGELPQSLSDGIGLLPVAVPTYFPADKLTRQPTAIAVPNLNGPQVRTRPESGKLVLRLWINNKGTVDAVVAEPNKLPEVFSRSALKAFKRSRFVPGEKDGVPVGAEIRIELTYENIPLTLNPEAADSQ